MFDQHFFGSGLSIFLPELFALESKSYHDSAPQCCPAQDPERITQRLTYPFWVRNQQPEFCSWQSILQARNLTPSLLPPWVLLGMPQDWIGSWPPCHVAANHCTGLRMNLLPWQESKHALRSRHGGEGSMECRLLLHNGFLLFFSHRGGPTTMRPSSRRAGAAWQNPADHKAQQHRGRGPNIAFLCCKLCLFPACCRAQHGKADPTAQGEPPAANTGHKGMPKF